MSLLIIFPIPVRKTQTRELATPAQIIPFPARGSFLCVMQDIAHRENQRLSEKARAEMDACADILDEDEDEDELMVAMRGYSSWEEYDEDGEIGD